LTDLAEPLNKTLRDFIVSKWSISNPGINDIRFKLDYYDGYGDYQIHFQIPNSNVRAFMLGLGYREYQELVKIFIFVRQNVNEEPVERDNIKREIQRIISDNNRSMLLAGATIPNSYIQIVNMTNSNKTSENVWESSITVKVSYWKVITIL